MLTQSAVVVANSMAYHADRAASRRPDPADLEAANRALRFAAYRNFTLWW